MAYNWRNMQFVIDHLHEHVGAIQCSESVHRTIVNRAYYCGLNLAATYIVSYIGDDLPEDSRYHGEVILFV